MKNYLILKTTKRYYAVRKNDDGTLIISNTTDGDPVFDSDNLIKSIGGIDAVLAKCQNSDIPVEKVREEADERRKQSIRIQQIREMERAEISRQEAVADYEHLLQQCGEIIPVTYDNLRIVMRYLRTQNWGTWELPPMSIPYAAHQYDCDGKTAVTMTLDTPFTDAEHLIENETRFVFGNPHGHLNKYRKIR